MDKLIKHAMDDDVVSFKDRFKAKIADMFKTEHEKVAKEVAKGINEASFFDAGVQNLISDLKNLGFKKVGHVLTSKRTGDQHPDMKGVKKIVDAIHKKGHKLVIKPQKMFVDITGFIK